MVNDKGLYGVIVGLFITLMLCVFMSRAIVSNDNSKSVKLIDNAISDHSTQIEILRTQVNQLTDLLNKNPYRKGKR
jgi:hypothetical protein